MGTDTTPEHDGHRQEHQPDHTPADASDASTTDAGQDESATSTAITGVGGPRGTESEAEVWTNRTPDRLVVRADGHQVTFPPLGDRSLTSDTAHTMRLTSLAPLGFAARKEPLPEEADLSWLVGALTFGIFAVLFGAGPLTSPREAEAGDVLPPILPPEWYWPIALALLVIVMGVAAWVSVKGGKAVGRSFAQLTTLVGVLAIGFGIPALSAVVLANEDVNATNESLYGVWLQVVFVGTASTLPSLLYFLFDRQRLSTLRERFTRQVFRLDPDLLTLDDLETKYGSQMEEAYGRSTDAGVRLHRQTRWPIMLATLIITVGWIVTLPPLGIPRDDGQALVALLLPTESLLTFGFLGAYFFALHTVLRRFVRADLRPKTYGAISVRILIVVVLAWLIDVVADGPPALVTIFLIGIIPETYVTFLQEALRSGLADRLLPRLAEKHPLDRLDGIDLYDRARLQDEGVSNVESLAHHDVIDLLLETRIPAARLVDWVDQAILYLHVSDDVSRLAKNSDGSDATRGPWLQHLQSCGVRTATDLEAAYYPFRDRPDVLRSLLSDGQRDDHVDGNPSETPPPALEILIASLSDDEWLEHIRHWRQNNLVTDRVVRIDGNGVVRDHRVVRPPLSRCSPLERNGSAERHPADSHTSWDG